MKRRPKKLNLTKDTVSHLDPEALQAAMGEANAVFCQESRTICSIRQSCVSCNTTLA